MNYSYELAQLIKAISDSDGRASLEVVLPEVMHGLDAGEAKLRLVGMYGDAMDELSLVNGLPEHRISELIKQVKRLQQHMLVAVAQANVSSFASVSKAQSAIQALNHMGDTIATARRLPTTPIDRKGFLASTSDLIDIVNNSNLPDMERSALTLKLKSIVRIINECQGLTDADIRRRIKSIYADLAADFNRLDGEHAGLFEKFNTWANKAARGGIALLGLTADVVGILSYSAGPAYAPINPPQQILQIESQALSTDTNSSAT